MKAADKYEIAGFLAYAREHYVQEAAAIKLLPMNGHTLSSVEIKIIAQRLEMAARCSRFAADLTNQNSS